MRAGLLAGMEKLQQHLVAGLQRPLRLQPDGELARAASLGPVQAHGDPAAVQHHVKPLATRLRAPRFKFHLLVAIEVPRGAQDDCFTGMHGFFFARPL